MTQRANPRLRAALVECTLVERKSGYLMIGKLQARPAAETNRTLLGLLARHPGRMRTIIVNGIRAEWAATGRR